MAPKLRTSVDTALSREYLMRNRAVKAVNAHLAGAENNTRIINKLLTPELCNRLFFHEDLDAGLSSC